jgi:hypothetical protein
MVTAPALIPGEAAEQARLFAAFERLPGLVDADKDLRRRGARCDVTCLIGLGDAIFHLTIVAGRIVSLERGPLLMRSSQFSFRASLQAWQKFWTPMPEPHWHDLFALTKRGEARLEGDIKPFMVHLQYFKDVLAAPRQLFREAA